LISRFHQLAYFTALLMFCKVWVIFSCALLAVASEDDPGSSQPEECDGGICQATDNLALLQTAPRTRGSGGWGWVNVTKFEKAYAYSGNHEVSGWMLVRPISWWPSSPYITGHALNWYLRDVDPRCSNGPASNNDDSCGVHVHEGKSCQEDPGEKLFLKGLGRDPWPCIYYRVFPETNKTSSKETQTPWLGHKVFDGIGDWTMAGHTIIVKDFDGVEIGCAVIRDADRSSRGAIYDSNSAAPPPTDYDNDEGDQDVSQFAMMQTSDITGLPAINWKPYYWYGGNLKITGYVWSRQNIFHTRGIGAFVSGKLSGVDDKCDKGPGSAPNSCGIVLFSGKSCEIDPGEPFWDEQYVRWINPWTCSAYTTLPRLGESHAQVPGFFIINGLSLRDMLGHAMILHDFLGHRVACSIVGDH